MTASIKEREDKQTVKTTSKTKKLSLKTKKNNWNQLKETLEGKRTKSGSRKTVEKDEDGIVFDTY